MRGFARSPERVALDVPVVAGDAVSGEGLAEALDGVDVAYFLIHGMEPRRRRPVRLPRARGGRALRRRGAAAGSEPHRVPRRDRPARRPAVGAPGQPAGGGGHPARGGAGLGRAARVDRHRRPVALVSLPGPAGRAHAGARLSGVAVATAPRRSTSATSSRCWPRAATV